MARFQSPNSSPKRAHNYKNPLRGAVLNPPDNKLDSPLTSEDLLLIHQTEILNPPCTRPKKSKKDLTAVNDKDKRRTRSESCSSSTLPVLSQPVESNSVKPTRQSTRIAAKQFCILPTADDPSSSSTQTCSEEV